MQLLVVHIPQKVHVSLQIADIIVSPIVKDVMLKELLKVNVHIPQKNLVNLLIKDIVVLQAEVMTMVIHVIKLLTILLIL